MVNKKHVICYFGVQLSLIFLVKVNCLPVCPCENSSLCGTISLSNRHEVTVDVAWSPRCIDLRCYDIPGLAMHTDFLFVMAYDEQSQIYGDRCVALANSDFNKTLTGLGQYIDLGIRPDQLVLGVPWYGYDYPCVELTEEVCSIRHVPFRGANCSDAAGRQVDYRVVYPMMVNHSIGGRQWDSLSWSPFFNYQDNITGYQHQVRYDDPESLSLKYRVAEDLGLRGVGCWHMDSLDYSDAPYAVHQTSEMFRVLPGYCDCSLQ